MSWYAILLMIYIWHDINDLFTFTITPLLNIIVIYWLHFNCIFIINTSFRILFISFIIIVNITYYITLIFIIIINITLAIIPLLLH